MCLDLSNKQTKVPGLSDVKLAHGRPEATLAYRPYWLNYIDSRTSVKRCLVSKWTPEWAKIIDPRQLGSARTYEDLFDAHHIDGLP